MEKPLVYVCSSPADKDWAEKFLQSLRPTLGSIATAAGGADENGDAGGGQASYRDALERSPLAILLTSPDFVSQFGDDDAAVHWLTEACRQRSPFLGYVDVEPAMAPLRLNPGCREILRRHGFDASSS